VAFLHLNQDRKEPPCTSLETLAAIVDWLPALLETIRELLSNLGIV